LPKLQFCCRHVAQRDCSSAASGQYIVIEGSQRQKKLVVNPFYAVRRNAEAVCWRLMAEFGLTPSSLNRVSQ
jgi:phage terminase small subunit